MGDEVDSRSEGSVPREYAVSDNDVGRWGKKRFLDDPHTGPPRELADYIEAFYHEFDICIILQMTTQCKLF